MSRPHYRFEPGEWVTVSTDTQGDYFAQIVRYSANGIWVRDSIGALQRVAWWRISRG